MTSFPTVCTYSIIGKLMSLEDYQIIEWFCSHFHSPQHIGQGTKLCVSFFNLMYILSWTLHANVIKEMLQVLKNNFSNKMYLKTCWRGQMKIIHQNQKRSSQSPSMTWLWLNGIRIYKCWIYQPYENFIHLTIKTNNYKEIEERNSCKLGRIGGIKN